MSAIDVGQTLRRGWWACVAVATLYAVGTMAAPVVRGSTRTNISGNANVNRNVSVNRNVNVNTSYHGGYYGGCCYNTGAAEAIGVAAAVTTAVVASAVVASIPPSCTTVIANGISYQKCGSTYYQPQVAGGSVTYIVVNHP